MPRFAWLLCSLPLLLWGCSSITVGQAGLRRAAGKSVLVGRHAPVDIAGSRRIASICCYETVSETHWAVPALEVGFHPQRFVDVSDHIDAKLAAMTKYVSQVRPAPDARSLEAVSALATWRGSTVGMAAAEAFVVVRECC